MKFRRFAALALVVAFAGTAAWAEEDISGIKAWEAEVFGDVEVTEGAEGAEASGEEAGAEGEQEGTLYDTGEEDWMTMLINRDNPIPEDWKVGNTVTVKGGEEVSRRILPALQAMFNAAREAGVNPIVVSGCRSKKKQENMLKSKYQEFREAGESKEDAQVHALQWVAEPNASEHVAGLGLDIGPGSGDKDKVYEWLANNSWKFGFILRYPEDKADITGIMYEPWHFRFVGSKAAAEIHRTGECLEEYYARMNVVKFRDQSAVMGEPEEDLEVVEVGGDAQAEAGDDEPLQIEVGEADAGADAAPELDLFGDLNN